MATFVRANDMQSDEVELKSGVRDALSMVVHDLKTPMAVINGYIEFLLSEKLGPLNEQQRAILVQSQASGERLASYIDNYLSLSALRAKKFLPELKEGRIQGCMEELRSFWRTPFENKHVDLVVTCDPAIEPFEFDCHKTQRVVSNLLENALQYSPAASRVEVRVTQFFWDRRKHPDEHHPERRWQCSSEANAVSIRVSDEGPGIPIKFREAVFEEYFRIPGRSAPGRGTGLGLAIARNLVEAMHGEIRLDTEVNDGSHFVVVLPIHRKHGRA
jgi:two-component system, OmpR family, phosphate regulon sensor histidine kinase PhoR